MVLAGGCASHPSEPASPYRAAVAKSLREARAKQVPVAERAALYVQTAAVAAPQLGSGTQASLARDTYNTAAAELTVLLRSADDGALWNRPLTLTAHGSTYRLRLAPSVGKGLWAPDTFTAFTPASEVNQKNIDKRNRTDGVGGALVGIRKEMPRQPFAPRVGITAPVTATLDFRGRDVTLTLRDPGEQPAARVAGTVRPLAADFSAPLAYYPTVNETWLGLMGAIRVSHYMGSTGLYFLQPYNPDRIPLIFVHGLISTPQMWRNVINEIETDPELRGRFQYWVFAYPTGNPFPYSALRLREELGKVRQIYGWPHGFVLISHSMGGLLAQMQATTLTREDWHRTIGKPADELFARLPSDSLIHRALIFDANPDVRRIVFICTPHRGSDMAVGSVGEIGMRLIALPANLASTITKSVGNTVAIATGNPRRIPNSVTSLSPKNPSLKTMNSVPIRAPHHTILGDRGRGDSPNSSDGVVAYWSSHLDSAQSEKIVPGPHGSCELPQTIEELKRILHLHLKTITQ